MSALLDPSHYCLARHRNSHLSLLLWHHKLGHIGLRPLKSILLAAVTVLVMNEVKVQRCSTCVESKMAWHSFTSHSAFCSSSPGDLIHSNVCSFEVASREGFRYFVTFIDDYSKLTMIYPMKSKSDTFSCFKAFRSKFELQLSTRIRKLCSDNDGEYLSEAFISNLPDSWIEHHPGLPHSPQLNGVSERANYNICNHVRCSLSSSGPPKYYWVDASWYLAHSLNSVPCVTPSGFVSPCSLVFTTPVDMTKCHPFRCEVYFKVPEVDHLNLDPKARRAVFLSCLPDGNGYQVWDIMNSKTVKTRDVVFNDDIFPSLSGLSPPPPRRDAEIPWPVAEVVPPYQRHRRLSTSIHNPSCRHLSPPTLECLPVSPPLPPVSPPSASPHLSSSSPSLPPAFSLSPSPVFRTPSPTLPFPPPCPSPPVAPRCLTRTRSPPSRLGNFVISVAPVEDDFSNTPKTWKQLLQSPNKASWLQEDDAEFYSLIGMDTWRLVPLPLKRKVN